MEQLNLKDIANDLFILNKYTIDKLFASDNPADAVALYCFYYKTAKWQQTNSIWATNEYVKKGLKWGIDRINKAKNELKQLGLINIIQRRDNGKISGWYIEIAYLVGEAKLDIKVVNNDQNTQNQNTQNAVVEQAEQEYPKPRSRFQETDALKQNTKCLKIKRKEINKEKENFLLKSKNENIKNNFQSEQQTKAIETINFIKKDIIALKTKINRFIDKVNNIILNKKKFDKIIDDRIKKGITQFWDLEYLSLYKLSEDTFVSFNKTSFAASLWKQGLKKELSDEQMTTIFTLLKAYKYGD